ncbi:MAG: translation elongation factor 4 [Candidatus Pacebacteria bacterium]|nr:translation elongation factor 4 [Candidatus Paceibacterota bacterium]
MAENQKNIRNFCIIAHIDHGKSTLADRFLELTATIEKRKMREQFLDQMDLERERGITIKMQPVRMNYQVSAVNYQMNLIDTPGHVDFSYEVSRSLKAVEGAVLLVDATQGVQAQTVTNLEMAKALGLVIIPVINKIDSINARVSETRKEIIEVLHCDEKEILEISAKTGEGVSALLEEIIKRIPSPPASEESFRALVFDFDYSLHRGVILYIRATDGEIKKGDSVFLRQAGVNFQVAETGIFMPEKKPVERLKNGEIGYVVTNIKEANIGRVGDTLLSKFGSLPALEGYKQPFPVVWASVFPESQDSFESLKQALSRLKLSDSAFAFSEEESGLLGRGFRCGFLGLLHLEIVVERLRRDFGQQLVTASPSVVYRVETKKGGTVEIYSPALFPEHHEIIKIFEPWAAISIITPNEFLNEVMQILNRRDAVIGYTEDFGSSRLLVKAEMPLREMMDNFFEEMKSATSGYASFGYEVVSEKEADVVRMDVLLNDEIIPAFSRIVKRSRVQSEAQKIAKKLKEVLPRQLFVIKIQARALGRILAAESITALKKNVTAHLYGGDRTRKMKLWQKQKKGKKRLKEFGKVSVPHEVFLKMIKNEN